VAAYPIGPALNRGMVAIFEVLSLRVNFIAVVAIYFIIFRARLFVEFPNSVMILTIFHIFGI
jgi:hypothetical protein